MLKKLLLGNLLLVSLVSADAFDDIDRKYSVDRVGMEATWSDLGRAGMSKLKAKSKLDPTLNEWNQKHQKIVNERSIVVGNKPFATIPMLTGSIKQIARENETPEKYEEYLKDLKKWYCDNINQYAPYDGKLNCGFFSSGMTSEKMYKKWFVGYYQNPPAPSEAVLEKKRLEEERRRLKKEEEDRKLAEIRRQAEESQARDAKNQKVIEKLKAEDDELFEMLYNRCKTINDKSEKKVYSVRDGNKKYINDVSEIEFRCGYYTQSQGGMLSFAIHNLLDFDYKKEGKFVDIVKESYTISYDDVRYRDDGTEIIDRLELEIAQLKRNIKFSKKTLELLNDSNSKTNVKTESKKSVSSNFNATKAVSTIKEKGAILKEKMDKLLVQIGNIGKTDMARAKKYQSEAKVYTDKLSAVADKVDKVCPGDEAITEPCATEFLEALDITIKEIDKMLKETRS